MQHNPIKQTLQAGRSSLGTFVFEFNTNGIARIASAAGAAFALYDMEHTGWSVETINRLISTTPRSEIVPFVRVPATEYHFVARVLDMGAMGVLVPLCESAEQAEQLVSFAKYPPVGRRGAAFNIAHDDYRTQDVAGYMERANQETLLIAQIETRSGLDDVDRIAAVDGIDVLWIGQTDLTSSLGIPFQFDHPDYHAAIDKVLAACTKHGKAAGFMPLAIDEAKSMMQRGFRMIAYSGDLWIYQQSLRAALKELNAELTDEHDVDV
jgi:2-keto-3-deoxy-L-rhamnonate aldolase RhmA